MEKEKRNDRLIMKIQPSLKAAAKKAAAEDGRTLSNYIEQLIKEDLAKRKEIKMKKIYSVCDMVREIGFNYKTFKTLEEAKKEVERRLNEKNWTLKEIEKEKPYIEISEEMADEDGEIVEYVNSIEDFYYTEKNAVL